MKIFFIIPVYKTEAYLARCVDSVLNQIFKDTQIVLVDDGSPDRAGEICDEYASRYDNVKVIHKKNGGLSDARNTGIDFAEEIGGTDDYITFLDSDDFVSKDFAQRLISLCEENGCEAAQCDYEKGDGTEFQKVQKPGNVFFKDAEGMLLDRRLKSQSCSKIYRLGTFKNVRFPTGVLNEDEFTTYLAIYNCNNVVVTDEKLYYYFQHSNSIMDDIAKRLKDNPHLFDWLDAYEKRIKFFEKENKPEQVLRTHEKICTDVILRYCEQMYLKKEQRDEALTSGKYLRLYRRSFPVMIKRRGMALRHRLMYIAFYIWPQSAILPGKILGLRK